MHPQSDTTRTLIQVENQAPLLLNIINTWTLTESGTMILWTMPLPQVDSIWSQPEADISRSWFKIQTGRLGSWEPSESQTVGAFTQFGAVKGEPLAQHETFTVISSIQTETDIVH